MLLKLLANLLAGSLFGRPLESALSFAIAAKKERIPTKLC